MDIKKIMWIENWLKTQTRGDDEWQCVYWGSQESEQGMVIAKYIH